MGRKYAIRDQDKPYFITFTVVNWIDVFTRQEYRDIFLESVRYYIHQNPVKAGIVLSPEEYYYSSAKNYAEMPDRLLEVILV